MIQLLYNDIRWSHNVKWVLCLHNVFKSCVIFGLEDAVFYFFVNCNEIILWSYPMVSHVEKCNVLCLHRRCPRIKHFGRSWCTDFTCCQLGQRLHFHILCIPLINCTNYCMLLRSSLFIFFEWKYICSICQVGVVESSRIPELHIFSTCIYMHIDCFMQWGPTLWWVFTLSVWWRVHSQCA